MKNLVVFLFSLFAIFTAHQVFAQVDFTAMDIAADIGDSRDSITTDFNGDTFQDIYVANSGNTQNKLWINDGVGNFTANDIAGDLGNSFGATTADFNGDTFPDIYVANNAGEQNKLWLTGFLLSHRVKQF